MSSNPLNSSSPDLSGRTTPPIQKEGGDTSNKHRLSPGSPNSPNALSNSPLSGIPRKISRTDTSEKGEFSGSVELPTMTSLSSENIANPESTAISRIQKEFLQKYNFPSIEHVISLPEASMEKKFQYLQKGMMAKSFFQTKGRNDLEEAIIKYVGDEFQEIKDIIKTESFNIDSPDESVSKEAKKIIEENTKDFKEAIEILIEGGHKIEEFPVYRGQSEPSLFEEGKIFMNYAPMSFSISKKTSLNFAYPDGYASSSSEDNASTNTDNVSLDEDENLSNKSDTSLLDEEKAVLLHVFGARAGIICGFGRTEMNAQMDEISELMKDTYINEGDLNETFNDYEFEALSMPGDSYIVVSNWHDREKKINHVILDLMAPAFQGLEGERLLPHIS